MDEILDAHISDFGIKSQRKIETQNWVDYFENESLSDEFFYTAEISGTVVGISFISIPGSHYWVYIEKDSRWRDIWNILRDRLEDKYWVLEYEVVSYWPLSKFLAERGYTICWLPKSDSIDALKDPGLDTIGEVVTKKLAGVLENAAPEESFLVRMKRDK